MPAWPAVTHLDVKHTRSMFPRGKLHQSDASIIAVCAPVLIFSVPQPGGGWLSDLVSVAALVQHSVQLLPCFDPWPPKEGWTSGGHWHNGGWYDGNNSHSSGWKGKGSSEGYRGWHTHWNSQPSGSWQEPNRTQWFPAGSLPPLRAQSSLPLWVQSVKRTTSSWVSGALDTLTNVVRRAVTPLSGGQTTPSPRTDIQAPANAGDTMGKLKAETTRKPELLEGDARVTRQLIDELKKETASFRRTCDEKTKRTRAALLE